MIGIIILGVGLVMVATIFPVAWSRARTLNEFTTERAANDTAHDAVRSLTRVSTAAVGPSSFLGDLTYYDPGTPVDPADDHVIEACAQPHRFDERITGYEFTTYPDGPPASPPWAPPDWVHALNVENVTVAQSGRMSQLVAENPWVLQEEDPARPLSGVYADIRSGGGDYPAELGESSFLSPRIALHQRVYPMMGPRPDEALPRFVPLSIFDTRSGTFDDDSDAARAWDEDLASHRYAWAVFHRLQQPISLWDESISAPSPAVFERTKNAARTFDMYYVLLRRAQPTFRFARQEPRSAPSPCALSTMAVTPEAADPSVNPDVMLPVAWRVQVQFPNNLTLRNGPPSTGPSNATGIPTEIEVPPPTSTANATAKFMWLQMFQPGTKFIDEITGMMFRVNKRRLNAAADQATLTLDQEVFLNDIDLPEEDPRCGSCSPINVNDPLARADPVELLRTVWVFPPPVEPRASAADPLVFVGAQPVVSIDVRTLTIGPTY